MLVLTQSLVPLSAMVRCVGSVDMWFPVFQELQLDFKI